MTAPSSDDRDGVSTHERRAIGRRTVLRTGASAALVGLLAGCRDLFDDDDPDGEIDVRSPKDIGRVIVVGAGAAGMSAAALLRREGVDVRVLEARPTHGGRMRHTRDFVDFPIPLGAEWLHERPAELAEIIGESDAADSIALVGYRPSDEVTYFDGERTDETMGADVDTDLKFVGSSWLDVFERYVLPDISDVIEYGVDIVRVDHRADVIRLTTSTGQEHLADAVIVTVPLALLQAGHLEFDPPLPDEHRAAVDRAEVWGGIKVFLEFSERFYPVFLAFPDSDTDGGQRLYYDAAYGQDSDAHVLGLFAVGEPAARYQSLDPDEELVAFILDELDEVFDGAASATFIRHLVLNWDEEPYSRGAYLADEADDTIPRQLQARFSDRVLLAGDAYTSHGDWSAVDDAARSARDAVRHLLA